MIDLETAERIFQPYKDIVVTRDVGAILIGPAEQKDLFRIVKEDDDEFKLYWGDWHGHFETVAKACETCLQVLQGICSYVTQHRGDQFASCWLHESDGEGYYRNNQSVYLNPFDQDEWTLYGDEKWRVEAHFAYLIPSRLKTVEPDALKHGLGRWSKALDGYSPYLSDPWMLSYIPNLCGAPPIGWRWSSAKWNNVAFLAPLGWRTQKNESANDEHPFDWLQSPDSERRLFVTVAFSPPEPQDIAPGSALFPTSLEAFPREYVDSIYRWRWEALFEGPEERMWVQFTFDSSFHDDPLALDFDTNLRSSRRLIPNSE